MNRMIVCAAFVAAFAAVELVWHGLASRTRVYGSALVALGWSALLAGTAQGFFAREEIAVEIQRTPSSQAQRAALLQGNAEIVHASFDDAVSAVEDAGADFVYAGVNTVGRAEYAVANVLGADRRWADWPGPSRIRRQRPCGRIRRPRLRSGNPTRAPRGADRCGPAPAMPAAESVPSGNRPRRP